MAAKKSTRTKSSGKTKKTTRSTTRRKSNTRKKRQRVRKGTSKKITYWIFYIAVAFIAFICYMMYQTQDLSPVEYIADIIKIALPIGIIAYMYRAVMEDKIELQLKYNEELAKDKRKYGDIYSHTNLEEPDFLKRN